MALLVLDDIHKAYPEQELLRGVSLVIEADTRIGIVGRNGTGKSTLMRIFAGVEEPDSGQRTLKSGLRVGHLIQEAPEYAGRVRDAVRGDGHAPDHRVEEFVSRVGLPDPDVLVSTLSGGERRRVSLARVLVEAPDLLLLDEPTNHLDAFVIDWLEDHLLKSRLPVVMVTHDRYFLDRVVDRVIEIDRGALHSYDGGYAGYLRGKAARAETDRKGEVARQGLLRRETDWMRRGPPARSTKAKARIARYHHLLDDAPEAPPGELAFAIPPGPRLGTRVVRARDLALRVADRTLVEGLDLDVGQGERLGIVGPNGAGKTTLLRAITGQRPPDAGTVDVGETVRLAAIDQQRADLDPKKTVVEEIGAAGDHVKIGERSVRLESFLDGFLFPGDRKHTRVERLSGGERNRVLLAKLLLKGGNVLVLDEPTNDLDLPTLRALEEALIAFEGSVVVVSHDRWFLDRVATEILHLDGLGRATRYGGGVSDLLERLSAERRESETASARSERARRTTKKPEPRARSRRLSTWETRELEALPAQIETADARLEGLSAQLADPALYKGPAAERERVQAEHGVAAAENERLYARWEELEALRDARS